MKLRGTSPPLLARAPNQSSPHAPRSCRPRGVCHAPRESDPKKLTHLIKTNDPRLSAQWGDPPDPFGHAWRTHAQAQQLSSPLDVKAREFALFYFDIGGGALSMQEAAGRYGIQRKTGAARLRRCEALGWIKVGDSPERVGRDTLPRVYRRVMFWSDEPWADAHAAYGDAPV